MMSRPDITWFECPAEATGTPIEHNIRVGINRTNRTILLWNSASTLILTPDQTAILTGHIQDVATIARGI